MRYSGIVIRVLKELLRDKRTLALMLVAPLLILTLMHVVFDSKTEKLVVGTNGLPSELTLALPKEKVTLKSYPKTAGEKQLADGNLAAWIQKEGHKLKITYQNEDPSKTQQLKVLLNQTFLAAKMTALAQQNQELLASLQQATNNQRSKPVSESTQVSQYTISNHYLYGTARSTFFDKIFPVLIGFFVFFFVFLISGIALLKERSSGTLERVLATPIKRSELVFGYLTGYGLFAIVQTIVIVAFSVYGLKIHLAGSLGWVVLINSLIALVALSMGIFVSTFATSEFQMMQFIPIVVIPQIFFSGILPLDAMADWVRLIGKILPLTYGGDALTAVMIKGAGFEAIWQDSLVLLLFLFLFTSLNILGLKRYRKV